MGEPARTVRWSPAGQGQMKSSAVVINLTSAGQVCEREHSG